MAARQSAINTCHYDGQPAPTAGARSLLDTKLAAVRELPVRVQLSPLTAA
jgi:hypothetical protein